jgi:phosphate uptake regulator
MMKGAIGYPNSASERAGWDRGKMLLDTFQQEIDNLLARMLDLGRQVEVSLENMVGAMEERDAGLAGKELGVDARYKARGADIDNRTMVLQVRWAPVARDLSLSRLFMMGFRNNLVPLVLFLTLSPFPRCTRFLLSRR